jgi:hypothetical protein
MSSLYAFLINLIVSGIFLPYLQIALISSAVSIGPKSERLVLLHIDV